jgi:heptaprenyl diphosphate synthase
VKTSAVGLDFVDSDLEKSVRELLDAVEQALRVSVASDDEFVAGVATYLVDAGGKRFRPLLAVLAAHFGDPNNDQVIAGAVVCELTHLATLYHDDVMDEATVRRGAIAANARWGNSVAILTGDFLFARASDILADLGPEAVRLQARCFERLVTGQIRETVGPAAGADPIEHHLGVLAEKTGSLIATSAEFGARFAGVDSESTNALREFGEQIGVAFQISDDILDIASNTGQSGKTPGTDLREGVQTLAALYAAQSADIADSRLRDLVSRPLTDDEELAEALVLLRASAAIEKARSDLQSYADAASDILKRLPDVPARAALAALTELVVQRSG